MKLCKALGRTHAAHCLFSGIVQGQVGWGLDQFVLMSDILACGRGGGK